MYKTTNPLTVLLVASLTCLVLEQCEGQTTECTVWSDCHKEGRMCYQLADAGCICKAGRCKISSGCGTHGAFFYTSCNSCNEDDCEDEGTCVWRGGECVARQTGGDTRTPECRTISDKLCILPFTYKGRDFSGCTTFDSANGLAWCATQVGRTGEVVRGQWEDCYPGCEE